MKWGDELNSKGRPAWEARVVDAYTKIENAQHPEKEAVIANKWRSQIMRAFARGNCSAEKLLRFYAAVDCRVKVVQK